MKQIPRQEVQEKDLLNFSELVAYIRGIGKTKLHRLYKQGYLPDQVVPGLWSRYSIDRWLGKAGTMDTDFMVDFPRREEKLSEVGERFIGEVKNAV